LPVIAYSYISRQQGGLDAETAKPRDRNPGPRSAGSEFRDPVVAGKCLKQQAEGEERSASSQGARKVASRWSRSSAKGRCREGSAEEGSGCDLGFEGEDRSPPSEASAWSRASARVEEEGGLMAKAEEPWTQLATRIPKELHRRLKLHCVPHAVALMHFVVEAIEEKLGRNPRPKKGTA